MPPSTHYLNLLNLNQADDLSSSSSSSQQQQQQQQRLDYSSEEIAKELELFANSNFLDTEPFFHQPTYDVHAFDSAPFPAQQQQQQSSGDAKHQGKTPFAGAEETFQYLVPTTSDTEFFTQTTTGTGKRPAEEEAEYSATPSSQADDMDHKRGKTLDEEDKRRRNTAASAKFRIKKKQREQALLDTTKQMADRNVELENRVKELEMENKWLRSLLKPVNAEQTKNVLASL